jgi:hypothetical protein
MNYDENLHQRLSSPIPSLFNDVCNQRDGM